MVVTRQRLIPLLPAGGAACAGIGIAALLLLVPLSVVEGWTWASGVAALVPMAAPPLGATARAVLALGGGMLAAAVSWAVLFLLWGTGGFLAGEAAADGMPSVRRADAHPDAPPRRPLSAADLGTPPPPAATPPERTLPANLDQPLAAFDPQAILPVPLAPVRPPAPLAPGAQAPDSRTGCSEGPEPSDPAPVDRIETFELTPMVRNPAPRAEPPVPQTIEALLRRLEQGSARRPPPAARALTPRA